MTLSVTWRPLGKLSLSFYSKGCLFCEKSIFRVSRVFAFVFNSDRPACIRFIKDQGEQAFAEEMTKRQCQTMKRR